jgi:hypothetical protein
VRRESSNFLHSPKLEYPLRLRPWEWRDAEGSEGGSMDPERERSSDAEGSEGVRVGSPGRVPKTASAAATGGSRFDRALVK